MENKENLREISDEELDNQIKNPDTETSEETSSDQETSDNRIEMEGDSTSEETSEETSSEEGTQDEFPEFVPENMREHYKNKNVDEFAKQMAHWQKVASKYGNYGAMFDLMEADPEARARAVRALTQQEQAAQAQGEQRTQDDYTQIHQGLIDDGVSESLANQIVGRMRSQDEKLNKLESTWTSSTQSEIQDLNQQAVQQFSDKYKLPQDKFNEVILNAEKYVRPTGRKGEYTTADIEAAFARHDPEGYRQQIANEERTRMANSLNEANQNNESTQGASANAQHDSHVNTKSKTLDGAQNADQFKDRLSELSDDELDEDLNSHGMKTFTPWRPGN